MDILTLQQENKKLRRRISLLTFIVCGYIAYKRIIPHLKITIRKEGEQEMK